MDGLSFYRLVETVRVYIHSTLQKKRYSHEKKNNNNNN